jgi:hypothetical protein
LILLATSGWHAACFVPRKSPEKQVAIMDENEVIAVLLSGYDDDGRQRATVLLRDARGHVSLRHVNRPECAAQGAHAGGIRRPGGPMLDPAAREFSPQTRRDRLSLGRLPVAT